MTKDACLVWSALALALLSSPGGMAPPFGGTGHDLLPDIPTGPHSAHSDSCRSQSIGLCLTRLFTSRQMRATSRMRPSGPKGAREELEIEGSAQPRSLPYLARGGGLSAARFAGL